MTVVAVKTKTAQNRIEKKLLNEYGQLYFDVWKVGVNTALRISDLLSLTYEQVAGQRSIEVCEGKTGKIRHIALNPTVRKIIRDRRKANPEHVYLFQSDSNRARALRQPLSRMTFTRALQAIGESASVGLSLGSHSMRKTWGYRTYKATNDIALVMTVLNHSNITNTLRYIGIESDDVAKALLVEL